MVFVSCIVYSVYWCIPVAFFILTFDENSLLHHKVPWITRTVFVKSLLGFGPSHGNHFYILKSVVDHSVQFRFWIHTVLH